MSSKAYVPPSMRRFTTEDKPAADDKPFKPSSRWTYTSRDASGQEQALTNTSLASKMAPELAPAIIAPIQRDRPSTRNHPALASEDEFPVMGKKPTTSATVSNPWSAKPSFASLSREWAVKQKQEEEEAKKEAERNALLERERRAQQEKEDKERRARQHLYHSSHLMKQNRVDDDKKYDMGGSRDVYEEMDSSSESETYLDEEEEEEVVDDTWERSRSKYDYY